MTRAGTLLAGGLWLLLGAACLAQNLPTGTDLKGARPAPPVRLSDRPPPEPVLVAGDLGCAVTPAVCPCPRNGCVRRVLDWLCYRPLHSCGSPCWCCGYGCCYPSIYTYFLGHYPEPAGGPAVRGAGAEVTGTVEYGGDLGLNGGR